MCTSDTNTILHLPLSADKAPQLVAYVTPGARGAVDVDGRGQVGTVVHCERRGQRRSA